MDLNEMTISLINIHRCGGSSHQGFLLLWEKLIKNIITLFLWIVQLHNSNDKLFYSEIRLNSFPYLPLRPSWLVRLLRPSKVTRHRRTSPVGEDFKCS